MNKMALIAIVFVLAVAGCVQQPTTQPAPGPAPPAPAPAPSVTTPPAPATTPAPAPAPSVTTPPAPAPTTPTAKANLENGVSDLLNGSMGWANARGLEDAKNWSSDVKLVHVAGNFVGTPQWEIAYWSDTGGPSGVTTTHVFFYKYRSTTESGDPTTDTTVGQSYKINYTYPLKDWNYNDDDALQILSAAVNKSAFGYWRLAAGATIKTIYNKQWKPFGYNATFNVDELSNDEPVFFVKETSLANVGYYVDAKTGTYLGMVSK